MTSSCFNSQLLTTLKISQDSRSWTCKELPIGGNDYAALSRMNAWIIRVARAIQSPGYCTPTRHCMKLSWAQGYEGSNMTHCVPSDQKVRTKQILTLSVVRTSPRNWLLIYCICNLNVFLQFLKNWKAVDRITVNTIWLPLMLIDQGTSANWACSSDSVLPYRLHACRLQHVRRYTIRPVCSVVEHKLMQDICSASLAASWILAPRYLRF